MITKWLKGLFTLQTVHTTDVCEQVEFEGYTIVARARGEQGQFRVAGTISKQGQQTEFIRSDLCPDVTTANT
ncbi:HlyU family transcriptional regulator [Motilimonas pumila]|uniref:Transcriptional regulator n=1 Tax=Motilimonas pumila TaxID=2303987 RepID=A0A418YD09_9GAMM|nr:HlyU family transcriptional regulator [Motilimonas pumila]RJG42361.1 transcriptional regulator [Motilimonas pumila]